jgi:hypothetical protein
MIAFFGNVYVQSQIYVNITATGTKYSEIGKMHIPPIYGQHMIQPVLTNRLPKIPVKHFRII